MKRLMWLSSFVALLAAPIAALAQAPPPGAPRGSQTPPPQTQNAPPQGGQNRNALPNAQAPPPGSPQNQQGPQPGRNGGTWQNIKIDLVITDTASPTPKKTVTVLVLDGWSAQVRSTSNAQQGMINVDVQPTVRADGRIIVGLTLQYSPELVTPQEVEKAGGRLASVNESLTLIVSDGKSTLASQSADSRTDRKVTVELVATVIK